MIWLQEGHRACKRTGSWFVGGDILTGALQRLIAYINIDSITLSSNEIQMETFWYWLTQVHLDNGR